MSSLFHVKSLNIFMGFTIFSLTLFNWSFPLAGSLITTPRYLYLSHIGMPSTNFLSFYFTLLFLWKITPDFFLFKVSLFSYSHFSITLITVSNLSLPVPIIARSSAYAYTYRPIPVSTLIKSLNIILNNVGLNTPPYITPVPIFTSSLPILSAVC